MSDSKDRRTNEDENRTSVLVVDDDRAILHMVDEALSPRGLRTRKATTSSEAARLVKEEAFALAILDVYLPDGTGLELARQIKLVDSHLPVIIITGLPDSENVRECVDIDVDGYLIKPVNIFDLVALAEELIEGYLLSQKSERSGDRRSGQSRCWSVNERR